MARDEREPEEQEQEECEEEGREKSRKEQTVTEEEQEEDKEQEQSKKLSEKMGAGGGRSMQNSSTAELRTSLLFQCTIYSRLANWRCNNHLLQLFVVIALKTRYPFLAEYYAQPKDIGTGMQMQVPMRNVVDMER